MSATIQEAFKSIADKNSDKLWLISEYDAKQGKLVLVEEGSSGYNDFATRLADDKIYFCVFKVYGLDQREACTSKRDKLVALTWVGPAVSPLKRNAPLQSRQERDATFTGIVTEIQSDEKAFFSAEAVAKKLISIGGAHKPSCYDFGDVQIAANFYEHTSV
jgi:hypothetical protein